MKGIEIIGVYIVPNQENVHLVEIKSTNVDIDFGLFTQENKTQPKENWQTAYDEQFLDNEGNTLIDSPVSNSLRAAFFFHHLHFNEPLITPFGKAKLLAPVPLPERLKKIIQYHDVD